MVGIIELHNHGEIVIVIEIVSETLECNKHFHLVAMNKMFLEEKNTTFCFYLPSCALVVSLGAWLLAMFSISFVKALACCIQ